MSIDQGIQSGAALHIGRNPKRPNNQDRVGVFEPVASDLSEFLYVLCDGMGGHTHGELASQIAVQEIAGSYRAARIKHRPSQSLRIAIRSAHEAIRRAAESLPPGHSIGTTAVAAVVKRGQIFIANVGDSRAYLLRDGELSQVTKDHTRSAELQVPADSSTAGLDLGPSRHALTRSLSTLREKVDPDLFEESFGPGDVLVLCSDGLWSMVSEKALTRTVQRFSPPEAAETLVKHANRAGGKDNVSVIVVGSGIRQETKEEDTGEMLVRATGS